MELLNKVHPEWMDFFNDENVKELEKILTTFDYDMAIWNSFKCQSHQGHIHLLGVAVQ